jgi:hypothetical protein
MQQSTLRRGESVQPFCSLECTRLIDCHEGPKPRIQSVYSLQGGFYEIDGANFTLARLLCSIDSGKSAQTLHHPVPISLINPASGMPQFSSIRRIGCLWARSQGRTPPPLAL